MAFFPAHLYHSVPLELADKGLDQTGQEPSWVEGAGLVVGGGSGRLKVVGACGKEKGWEGRGVRRRGAGQEEDGCWSPWLVWVFQLGRAL